MFRNICRGCWNGNLNVGGVEPRIGTNNILESLGIQKENVNRKKYILKILVI
jgi:hypothetical protein